MRSDVTSHVGFFSGLKIDDLIPQLKVRILELLLKMQPKLKVRPHIF